jgi:hypothetical protein
MKGFKLHFQTYVEPFQINAKQKYEGAYTCSLRTVLNNKSERISNGEFPSLLS